MFTKHFALSYAFTLPCLKYGNMRENLQRNITLFPPLNASHIILQKRKYFKSETNFLEQLRFLIYYDLSSLQKVLPHNYEQLRTNISKCSIGTFFKTIRGF